MSISSLKRRGGIHLEGVRERGLPDQERLEMVKTEVLEIPLDKIDPNPYQPRLTFDEDHISSLSASIEKYGLRQPILVVKGEGDRYFIEAGENRFRAHQNIADMSTIPCIVKNESDANSMAINALVENIHRKDLHPIEVARAIYLLIQCGEFKNQTEVVENLKMSKQSVSRYIKASQLSDDAYAYSVKHGYKCVNVFALLAKIDIKKQAKVLAYIVEKSLNERDAMTYIKKAGKLKNVNPGGKPYIRNKEKVTINLKIVDESKKEEVNVLLVEIYNILAKK
jgi:ParB family transcriptional regulator, chromosome partitioning protein